MSYDVRDRRVCAVTRGTRALHVGRRGDAVLVLLKSPGAVSAHRAGAAAVGDWRVGRAAGKGISGNILK